MNWLINEINRRFYYDPSSPSGLRWKENLYTGKFNKIIIAKKDTIAGSLNTRGYYYIAIKKKHYGAARIVWMLHNGLISGSEQIDHIDRNKVNNCIDNLRIVDIRVNSQNRGMNSRNKSGINGVTFYFTKSGIKMWSAHWTKKGKSCKKDFSTRKYGEQLAFDLAVKTRNEMIAYLNLIGENYSPTHGLSQEQCNNIIISSITED